ncbi:MAG: tetratricopeptide repeat protein [Arcobacteraceae bacterium]
MKIVQIILMIWIIILAQGCVTSSNYLTIEQLQEKALLDDAQAQYKLAIYYEYNKNFQEALMWYEKSASKEYTPAQNELGNIYLEGRLGIEKDLDKAFEWYQKASDNGYFDAINNLGYMYDLGLGTKQDYLKAAKLYELAASQGSIRAMYNLGIMYKQGQGVKKDMIQAYKWLDLARFYTLTSKNMTLKWSIRKQWDKLESTMSHSDKEIARSLATKWQKELKNL